MSPHTSRRHADTSQKKPSGVYREDPADIKTIIWASIRTLLGFKIVTSIIILIAFPELVTAFLDKEIVVAPDFEVIVPQGGQELDPLAPPAFDLNTPPPVQ